jgi:hypothetical protein
MRRLPAHAGRSWRTQFIVGEPQNQIAAPKGAAASNIHFKDLALSGQIFARVLQEGR